MSDLDVDLVRDTFLDPTPWISVPSSVIPSKTGEKYWGSLGLRVRLDILGGIGVPS